jgi:hypothetical protein
MVASLPKAKTMNLKVMNRKATTTQQNRRQVIADGAQQLRHRLKKSRNPQHVKLRRRKRPRNAGAGLKHW